MSIVKYDTLYEDDNIIAINKPSGMLTIPDRHSDNIPCLRNILQKKSNKIFVVHRLDKDTSGVIVFAKNEVSHKYFSELFENRKVEKIYLGLITGKPITIEGKIREPIAENRIKPGTMITHHKGKPALTYYRTIQIFPSYSLVEFNIQTGRTHQIRVHCKHIGHPIACDPIYGDSQPIFLSHLKKRYKQSKNQTDEKPLLSRLALHAYTLSFENKNGQMLHIEAPLPRDIGATIKQLKKLQGLKH